jgi:ABC-type multidrug transport system fused ATPase/permease subunit
MQWIFTVAGSVLSLFPQLVLYKFLQAIEDREEPETTDPYVFVWAFALLFSQAVGIGFQTWSSWFTATRLIAPASSLLQSLIFSKAMRQYDTAIANQGDDADNTRDERSAEKMKEKLVRQSVINHMQMDTSRVTMFFMFNSHIPSAFTNFFLAGSFLVRLMGWRSVLAGILAAGLMAPFTAWFGRSYSKLTISLMISRDSKANVLTEVLQGMRQIKYSGLERHWEKKMLARREEELEKYRTVSLWGCLLIFLVNLGPILLGCVTFSVYAWQNGTHIKASVIFTSLDLLNRVSSSMSALPMLQMLLLEAWTSCKRLDKYLSQADREPVAEPGARICFEKATVAWPKAEDGDSAQTPAARPEERSMLRDITLEIPTGKLSVVTGKTGSGKSLLLAAVLGEVKLVSGSIHTPQPSGDTHSATDLDLSREWIIPSSMAFVSQTPWIESGTLKENITFGLPFDDSRYKKVLYACALEKDIEHLADGEQTQVGAKGVTLSGGQRWRLALARALYSRAATIILDDVLSAVDSHVGKTIVEEGLTGELARGRTRVLATHHAELVLPHAHYLIELRDGRLESAQAIDQSTSLLGGRACSDRDTGSPAPPGTNGNANASKIDREASHQYVAGEQRPDARLSLDESHEAGRVKWRVYMAYFRASGPFIWTVGVGMLIVTRVVGVTETWALKELTETASLEATSTSIPPGKESQLYRLKNLNTPTSDSSRQIIFWLGLYVLLHIVGGVLRAGNMVASLTVSLKTSRVLFQRMTHAVLRAPLRWMDQVPSGRILNRFTSDISQIDQRVARETLDLITSALALAVITGTR